VGESLLVTRFGGVRRLHVQQMNSLSARAKARVPSFAGSSSAAAAPGSRDDVEE
jgi:hypothetical protein